MNNQTFYGFKNYPLIEVCVYPDDTDNCYKATAYDLALGSSRIFCKVEGGTELEALENVQQKLFDAYHINTFN